MIQISLEMLVGTLITIFGLFGGLNYLFLRSLIKTQDSKVKIRLEAFEKNFEKDLSTIKEDVKDCEGSGEKLQDKWEKHLDKMTVQEATWGQRVKALFRNYDEMKVTVKELRPALEKKVDDTFRLVEDKLRGLVRDLVLQEVDRERNRS